MSQRRNRRAQCSHDNCGSRRFHVDGDGFTYCDQGHQQSELGTVVAEDTGELVTLGRTSRRRADSDVESQTSRVSGFSGPKAFEHYLLCLQLVLRKQLRWLIDVQGLPEELESLVRDLWTLQLQRQRERVSNESGTDTEVAGSQFSSQSENETEQESVRSSRSQRSARRTSKRTEPGLKDLASLLYIGVLLLRIPLTVADIHRWINNGELPYYRAAKEIPLSMLDRLPGERQRLLEPQLLLTPNELHCRILESLSTLHAGFGLSAPPLNGPLVLYRWVKELYLPLEIYVAVQRLGGILRTDFAYTVEAQAWSKISLRYPEVRLMGLVVIATKLLFPFDDQQRYPKSANDLAALQMNWTQWSQTQSPSQDTGDNHGEDKRLTYEDCFTMTEHESIDLAGDRLDDYLTWYESNIASEAVRERGRAGREADFRRALFRLFPTTTQPSDTRAPAERDDLGTTSAGRLHDVQRTLRPRRIVPEEESDDRPRPGHSYRQYRSEDQLDGTIGVFYDRAAELAGISRRALVRAVFSMERRLLDWEQESKKRNLEQSSTSAV